MEIISDKIMLTKHFDSDEFACNCGKIYIDETFVKRLEKFYEKVNSVVPLKAVIINSGYRCNKCSTSIKGAFIGDMHNKGAAADLHAIDTNGNKVDSIVLCEAAQLCGFGGIAVITAYDIHVDDRQRDDVNYTNRQWYGNESLGINYTTFIGKSKYTKQLNAKANQKYFEIMIDDHKYSGLLEEL